MARIEELRDDIEKTLAPDDMPKFDVDDDSVCEEMYHNRLVKQGAEKEPTNPKSFEDVMQELSKTPLFMNNLSEAVDAGMQNFRTVALSLHMLRSDCRW